MHGSDVYHQTAFYRNGGRLDNFIKLGEWIRQEKEGQLTLKKEREGILQQYIRLKPIRYGIKVPCKDAANSTLWFIVVNFVHKIYVIGQENRETQLCTTLGIISAGRICKDQAGWV